MATSPHTADEDIGADSVNLLSLPPELFERIAQSTPARDLPSLRLACRETAAKVERTFIKAHFSERGFLLCSKQSLQTAVKIIKHAKFRAAMKTMFFYVDVIDPGPFEEPIIHNQDALVRITQSIDRDRLYATRHGLVTQHRDIVEQGDDLNLLTVLFSLLRHNNVVVHVVLEGYVGAPISVRPPWYHRTLSIETGEGLRLPPYHDHHGISILMDALALSGYQPLQLSLGGKRWTAPLHGLCAAVQQSLNPSHIFSTMSALDLGVWALWDWESEDPW